jgi:pyrroloquinoline quinone biosynthesis protein B
MSARAPGLFVLALVAACPAERPPAPSGSRLRVLGIAQDGGLPHAGCTCSRCGAARTDPTRAAHVASLALVGEGGVVLVDATPDLRAQLDALADVRDAPAGAVDRAPVDGVLLTHAHIGHYLGLAFLGFEAIHAQAVPVWATPRMGALLREHAPWRQLVEQREIDLRPLEPGTPLRLGDVTVTAFAVPHRDEYSDTVGYRFEGPRRTVVYVPDTEPWSRWPTPIEDALAGADVALLDGTFYSPDELPGRPVESIGHPLVVETMDRLAPLVDRGLVVYFTHLNHSNPALDPDSAERRAIETRGFRVLAQGTELPL